MTMFSLHPVKPITTGEGGIITTNSEAYFEKLKLFRSHGISKTSYATQQGDWYYEMTELSFNYRMSNIQAALGLSQMRKLDGFIERRRGIAGLYHEKLAGVPGVVLPEQLAETKSGWHLYMIQLDSKILTKSRREIFDEMRGLSIGVHVHYIPVYWQALTLPIYPGMTDENVGDVVGALGEVIG